jgi:protocatechuate 4,5-dioxygenase beta chain
VATLVEIIGLSHSPNLAQLARAETVQDAIRESLEEYQELRRRLAAARPDVLVVVSSDHLGQWFMDNMPAFSIGKAPVAEGPMPHERRQWGLPPYRVPVDGDFAVGLLRQGHHRGVDFAFSDEFRIDHGFTIPLGFVRPEQDLPIVPVWTNVMAPPVPPAERFYAVGETLRESIEALPSRQRIAVVSSGHLANEIGGPKRSSGSPDPGFDRHVMGLIAAGDAPAVVREATWERLMAAGNVTPAFLNYVLLMGLAGGEAPSSTGLRFNEITAALHYMEWRWQDGEVR